MNFSVLDDHAERIAHDCNKHIEHGNLGYESRHQEENITQVPLGIVIEGIHFELSKREHILV